MGVGIVCFCLSVNCQTSHHITSKWYFRDITPTKEEERRHLAACLKKSVYTAFDKHLYQVGGHIFQQVDGAPIGDVISGDVADVEIEL